MDTTLNEERRLETPEGSKYRYYKKTFLYSAIIAVAITLPFVIYEWVVTGHGVFLYYGDYNAQQLAFYRHCVDAVHQGNFGWDWYTDLGSNFVGSYSYYMIGSPFFWIMCLFPSSWAPYLMGPVYILKYITAAMLAYCYLKRWVKNKDYAVLGALLYAFCGFQVYNTFFNQYHEVVALFPLLLIGMEELVQNDRKGIFAVAVALNAMCNYFMFAGQVVFCVLYFFFRFADRSFRITLKRFGSLVLEAVLGAMMSMVLFWPAALGVLGNSRVNRSFATLQAVLYWKKDGGLYWQRYGQILESYFFPPDIPSRVNFFYGHTERWASISGWLPMFGMTGTFALFTTKRRNWLKALIVFLIICSFVPGLNSMFFLGNSSYYARWFYLMVMMMIVGTILALDNPSSRWKGALAASLTAILAIAIPLGLRWYDDPSTEKSVDYQLGRAPFPLRFWLYTGIAIAGVWLLWFLIKHYRGTKVFTKALLIATSVTIVVYACIHIENGKEHSHASDFMVDQCLNGEVELPDPEENFYRIDFYRTDSISTIDNLGLYWHYPSIECFHTVIPPSIMDFYNLLGYYRSVGSRTLSSWYGLRAFTSTRYSLIREGTNGRKNVSVDPNDESEIEKYENSTSWDYVGEQDGKSVFVKEQFATDKGWTYVNTQNKFDIYENEHWLPMGFYYDEFMTETQFKKLGSGLQRTCLLCNYLVVPDDMAEYYSRFMTQVNYGDKGRKSANFQSFEKGVEERRNETCENFVWGSSGFSADITTKDAEIVFFSVPAEDGWSAKVNGKKAEVLTVFAGLMAVEVPAGTSHIEFSYVTNGIGVGAAVTGVGIAVFVVYLLYYKKKKHKAGYRFFAEDYYEEGDVNLPSKKELKQQKEAEKAAEAEHSEEAGSAEETENSEETPEA